VIFDGNRPVNAVPLADEFEGDSLVDQSAAVRVDRDSVLKSETRQDFAEAGTASATRVAKIKNHLLVLLSLIVVIPGVVVIPSEARDPGLLSPPGRTKIPRRIRSSE